MTIRPAPWYFEILLAAVLAGGGFLLYLLLKELFT